MTDIENLHERPLSSFAELGKVAVLLKRSKRDLLYIPGFGPKSIDQVLKLLKKYNLKIRER